MGGDKKIKKVIKKTKKGKFKSAIRTLNKVSSDTEGLATAKKFLNREKAKSEKAKSGYMKEGGKVKKVKKVSKRKQKLLDKFDYLENLITKSSKVRLPYKKGGKVPKSNYNGFDIQPS